MSPRWLPVLLSAVVPLASCTGAGAVTLPDRSDPAVQQEEGRLAVLLGESPSMETTPGTCKVRLLGREGDVAFVWAECRARSRTAQAQGTSGPVRVEADRVLLPANGSEYPPTVRKLFPKPLADAILDHNDRLRP